MNSTVLQRPCAGNADMIARASMPNDPHVEPPRPTPEPRSVRGEYERVGVQAFYETEGANYRNPHEPQACDGIIAGVRRWALDLSNVLDFAAGSGEATLVLRELGAKRVTGIDPYTFEAYRARTGSEAERFSFSDVANGALAGRNYSLIVCSFALHLCEPSRLPLVSQQLASIAPALLIVTPHKRPAIREEWGWELIEEIVIARVRTRGYRSNLVEGSTGSGE